MNKNTQRIASFIFGVIFVCVLIVISFIEPNPTDFQYTIFRIVISLAAGGVVATFPGFIEVKFGNWLRAGGALAVFWVVYAVSPAALIKQDNSITASNEKLEIGIDTNFMDEYTLAHSVIRPKDKPPRIHQLSTWHKVVLNNQSLEPINVIELGLLINNQKTAGDVLAAPFFKKLYPSVNGPIFSEPVTYPIQLKEKEYLHLFISFPVEVSENIGEASLSVLHNSQSEKDSMIELFLFGQEPLIEFSKFLPTTVNGKEEVLTNGEEVSKVLSFSDMALFRQMGFYKEGNAYMQVALGGHDDGFIPMKTIDLFNRVVEKLEENGKSIASEVTPVSKAALYAKTSLNEVFWIEVKPSSSLIKLTQA